MILKPKAFLFDLNGTMIDDMGYHTTAWEDILNNDLKANLTREEVKKEMYGKNDELLVRVFGENHFTQEEMDKISMEKEKRYQKAFLPNLKLINGLNFFLETAYEKNILMAIGSAAIPFNIDFILDNLNIRHYFKAIVSANDVKISKPHPEVFLKAAQLLNADPKDCIVFEDAPKGVESALHAGMPAVVLTTMHDKKEFEQYNNVLAFIKDYNDEYIQQIFE
jgi:beta-phosphoglucomutase family hydrolase